MMSEKDVEKLVIQHVKLKGHAENNCSYYVLTNEEKCLILNPIGEEHPIDEEHPAKKEWLRKNFGSIGGTYDSYTYIFRVDVDENGGYSAVLLKFRINGDIVK